MITWVLIITQDKQIMLTKQEAQKKFKGRQVNLRVWPLAYFSDRTMVQFVWQDTRTPNAFPQESSHERHLRVKATMAELGGEQPKKTKGRHTTGTTKCLDLTMDQLDAYLSAK